MRQQADAAAEPMRAEQPAGFARAPSDRKTAAEPAPFAEIGLDHLEHTRRCRLIKRRQSANILPSRQGNGRRGGHALPIGRRAVRRDRFLQPAQRTGLEFSRRFDRGVGIPGLVRVDHKRGFGAEETAQRPQIGEIAIEPKAHFQLEGAIALIALLCREFFRLDGIKAGRIDGDSGLPPNSRHSG